MRPPGPWSSLVDGQPEMNVRNMNDVKMGKGVESVDGMKMGKRENYEITSNIPILPTRI